MKITIEQVSNGWLLHYLDDADSPVTTCYELTELGSQVAPFKYLIYDILDLMGPSTSRYSPERIEIRVVPGDKYSVDNSEILE